MPAQPDTWAAAGGCVRVRTGRSTPTLAATAAALAAAAAQPAGERPLLRRPRSRRFLCDDERGGHCRYGDVQAVRR